MSAVIGYHGRLHRSRYSGSMQLLLNSSRKPAGTRRLFWRMAFVVSRFLRLFGNGGSLNNLQKSCCLLHL
jgi:hypothetical protein